jgi:hypothetical protein
MEEEQMFHMWYDECLARGVSSLARQPGRRSGSGCARGEVVVVRFSEFLKYLIVLILVMALFVAVAS